MQLTLLFPYDIDEIKMSRKIKEVLIDSVRQSEDIVVYIDGIRDYLTANHGFRSDPNFKSLVDVDISTFHTLIIDNKKYDKIYRMEIPNDMKRMYIWNFYFTGSDIDTNGYLRQIAYNINKILESNSIISEDSNVYLRQMVYNTNKILESNSSRRE